MKIRRNRPMMPQERRLNTRKPLDQLTYVNLPFDNGGIVMDVSEGGLGFHAMAPIQANGPTQFHFAIDQATRIIAVGELAWIDASGKSGGFRFTHVPEEIRAQIREWAGESTAKEAATYAARAIARAIASALSITPEGPLMLGDNSSENRTAPQSVSEISAVDGTLETVPAREANPSSAPVLKVLDVVPSFNTENTESAANTESTANTENPRNMEAPAFGSPLDPELPSDSQTFSRRPSGMFGASFEQSSLLGGGIGLGGYDPEGEDSDSLTGRHPVAALATTVVLALVVSVGVSSYTLTTPAGERFASWGEKIWSGIYSQGIPVTPARPNSAPPSSMPDTPPPAPRP